MATISTSQTFDSAARTAGEAFTIQSGAVFTIDSDTRDGKNAAASRAGSMSSFTMTAASGGQVVVDGTKVWLIAYDGQTRSFHRHDHAIKGYRYFRRCRVRPELRCLKGRRGHLH